MKAPPCKTLFIFISNFKNEKEESPDFGQNREKDATILIKTLLITLINATLLITDFIYNWF